MYLKEVQLPMSGRLDEQTKSRSSCERLKAPAGLFLLSFSDTDSAVNLDTIAGIGYRISCGCSARPLAKVVRRGFTVASTAEEPSVKESRLYLKHFSAFTCFA